MSPAYRASGHASGNTATATATVPATCEPGDVVLIHLSLNAAGTVSTPTGVTLVENNTTVASFPNYLYQAIVDDGVTAGATLSFTINSLHAWTTLTYAASGVDSSMPFAGRQVASTTTTTATSPALTLSGSAGDSLLLEIISGKGNPGPVTAWTAPSGMTLRHTAPGYQGYTGTAAIAEGGLVDDGTYGSHTYTANQPFNIAYRTTIALAAAPAAEPNWFRRSAGAWLPLEDPIRL